MSHPKAPSNHRCNVCDYSEVDGSPSLNIPPHPSRKVSWSIRYKEHLCTDCNESIKENAFELEHRESDDGDA